MRPRAGSDVRPHAGVAGIGAGTALLALLALAACGPSSGGGAGSGGTGGDATGRGGAPGDAGAAGYGGTGGGGAPGGAGAAGYGGTGGGGAAGTSAAGTGGGTAGTDAGAGGTTGASGASGTGGQEDGAAAGDGGTAGAGGTGGPTPAPPWDWVSVIGTGQSLAVGGHGNAAAAPFSGLTQRFRNLKLSLGSASVPPWDPNNAALKMVPLVEPIRAVTSGYPSPYPRNIYGQSMHTSMSDEITTMVQAASGRDYITVATAVGEAGQSFNVIRKGATDTGSTGRAYAASLFEVAAIARLAKAAGKTYGVGAILLTHGEGDATSATFESDVVDLWSDYNKDVAPLTGQTTSIPLLQSQQHSSPATAGSRSTATLAQWKSGVNHPGDIVCTGPKYQYPYISDTIHLTNRGYDLLGEKSGQVFAERVVLGHDWHPLEPIGATRDGRVITVSFHVPVPPLAWDTTLPAGHQSANTEWSTGRGFEVRAGNTRVAITGVAIAGETVQITCGSDLPATDLVVGYAATTDGNARSGGTMRWGQLRDSDPFVGAVTGVVQRNFAVAFEMDVP